MKSLRLLGALLTVLFFSLTGAAQSARFTSVAAGYNPVPGATPATSSYAGAHQSATDAAGNTYLWVRYNGDLALGGVFHSTLVDSVGHMALVKLSATNVLLWLREINSLDEHLSCIDLQTDASGNVYALGRHHDFTPSFSIDGLPVSGDTTGWTQTWVAKWASTGAIQYARAVAHTADGDISPWRLQVSATGELGLIGHFLRTVVVGGDTLRQAPRRTNSHMLFSSFVAKLANTGAPQWARRMEDADSLSSSFAADLGFDQAGNLYFTGIYGARLGPAQSGIGGVVFPPVPGTFWVRLGPAGQVLHTSTVPAANGGQMAMAVAPDGVSYVGYSLGRPIRLPSGQTLRPGGAVAGFVFRYAPDGTIDWVHQISGRDTTDHVQIGARMLALNTTGGVLVGGSQSGIIVDGPVQMGRPVTSSSAAQHGWAMAINAGGEALWGQVMASTRGETGFTLNALPDGAAVLVAGTVADSLGLGSLTVSAPGNFNGKLIVARLSPQYNTLSGAAWLDANANSQQDPSEGGFPGGLVVEVNPGNIPCAAPETTGRYDAYVDLGVNFTASLPNPPPHYTVVTQGPPPPTFSTYGNVAAGRSFALQPIPNQQDVQVILTLLSPARPGNLLNYQVQYRNVGTVAIPAGDVTLAYDPRLLWQSSTQPTTATGVNSLTWSYAALAPGETRRLNVVFRLPATAVLGSVVSSTATLTPLTGDLEPADNTSLAERTVTGSYDPNDIQVNHVRLNTTQVAAGEWLEYTIRFQNHGTDTAFTVMLVDSLPAALLRLSSLQILAASHNCNWGLSPAGALVVDFPNIMLPAQLTNQIASDGFVRFRVQPAAALVGGDQIPNQARIHFDYNAPMTTNTVLTAIDNVAGLLTPGAADATVSVWPNPATSTLNVEVASAEAGALNLTVLDALGRPVLTQTVSGETTGRRRAHLDVRGLPAGLYLLRGQAAGSNAGPGFARRVVLR